MTWANLPSKAIEKIAAHTANKVCEETYDENQRLLTLNKLSKVCRQWNKLINNSKEGILTDDRVIECNEFPETAIKLVKLGKGVHFEFQTYQPFSSRFQA